MRIRIDIASKVALFYVAAVAYFNSGCQKLAVTFAQSSEFSKLPVTNLIAAGLNALTNLCFRMLRLTAA